MQENTPFHLFESNSNQILFAYLYCTARQKTWAKIFLFTPAFCLWWSRDLTHGKIALLRFYGYMIFWIFLYTKQSQWSESTEQRNKAGYAALSAPKHLYKRRPLGRTDGRTHGQAILRKCFVAPKNFEQPNVRCVPPSRQPSVPFTTNAKFGSRTTQSENWSRTLACVCVCVCVSSSPSFHVRSRN